MTISDQSRSVQAVAIAEARAAHAEVAEDLLRVRLVDGRELGVPLVWFPRLFAATPAQRATLELIGDGVGIHWPEIDEDLAVAGLLGREGQSCDQHDARVRSGDDAMQTVRASSGG